MCVAFASHSSCGACGVCGPQLLHVSISGVGTPSATVDGASALIRSLEGAEAEAKLLPAQRGAAELAIAYALRGSG